VVQRLGDGRADVPAALHGDPEAREAGAPL
jgi:hypothetical protein